MVWVVDTCILLDIMDYLQSRFVDGMTNGTTCIVKLQMKGTSQ